MSKFYRTLVRGTLVQQSGLCAGGTTGAAGDADLPCARDGRGRLTITGSGQAGALIETAGRIFPQLLKGEYSNAPDEVWNRISGKWWLGRKSERGRPDPEKWMRQSLWHFWPAHLDGQNTEPRQGVGIRQETGAAASEGRALFDIETIPAGTRWELFFEVDALRGGPISEAVALLALWEWTQGRCWLGASAARGLGWMKLEDVEVLRLPATPEAVDAWPDSRQDRNQTCDRLASLAEVVRGPDGLRQKAVALWERELPAERFWYLTLDATLAAGLRANGYGLDSLSVGGHSAAELDPLSDELLTPVGIDGQLFRNQYNPDAPVVVTADGPPGQRRPFVPGSGIRGPLRHTTSRWHRPRIKEAEEVPDPNVPENGGRRKSGTDAVSKLFGLVEHSARLLVRDARLLGNYRLANLQHHAEDEFTGGVYGSGKFDRTAVMEGQFAVRLVIEACDRLELEEHIKTVSPALRLAELGHVALGGGKWRGHGWLPWMFTRVHLARAGEPGQDSRPGVGLSVLDVIAFLRGQQEGGQL